MLLPRSRLTSFLQPTPAVGACMKDVVLRTRRIEKKLKPKIVATHVVVFDGIRIISLTVAGRAGVRGRPSDSSKPINNTIPAAKPKLPFGGAYFGDAQ